MFFFCVLYLPVSVQWIDPDNRIFYIPHSTATIILTDWVDFCVNRFNKNRFYVKKSGGVLAPPGALYAVVRA